MPQPSFDSDYIFGIHEPGGEHLMLAAGKPGWVLFSEVLGHSPNERSGKDYTPFADQGLAVMARLNNGYHPQGTLPFSSEYANFARRCANFVASSRGCRVWIIGNETNYAVERPGAKNRAAGRSPQPGNFAGADPHLRGLPERFNAQRPPATRAERESGSAEEDGEVITPEMYARCYRLCRDAIHRLPGHEEDRVLVGAVAPWNTHTTYNGNPSGDWIKYFQDILLLLGPSECDGVTLHTYTHGSDPSLLRDDSKLLSFPQHHYHFLAYRDFMQAIPHNMRQLPVYITETDQVTAWEDVNRGWVQSAYEEIDGWNRRAGSQKIRALILYRWPQNDQWHIEGKPNLIDDFRVAMRNNFRWENADQIVAEPAPAAEPAPERASMTTPTAPAPELSGPAYRVQWLQGQLPRPLNAGQTLSFPVTVRNAGVRAWVHSGSHPVRLGYRFYQNRQEVVLRPDQQIRSALPRTVNPGESITFDARVKLPDSPGNYTLQLDLVHEGVTWFADQQSDVLTRWLTITGEAVSPPVSTEFRQGFDRLNLPAQPTIPTQTPQADPPPIQAIPPAPLPVSTVVSTSSTQATQAATPPAASFVQTAQPQPQRITPAPQPVKWSQPVQTAQAAQPSQPLTPPTITDISASLPRGAKAWEQRPLSQVRHLIINHTGAPPLLPLQIIAQAHVDRGYPGIAYDFYISQSGQIFQVSPLEAVVKADAEWSGGGVNICLEGNFDNALPPPAQLTATAHLCAWMLQRTGLLPQNIIGLREVLQTSSPGNTFLTRPGWKNGLVAAVRQLLEAAAPPSALPTPAPLLPAQSQRPNPIPRPPIQDIVARLPRDPSGFFSRRTEDIQHLVINHTAAPADVAVEVIANAFRDKLPGILYQFFITADGQILQTQPLLQVVDGERPYIAQAVNIAFAGDFTTEIPTTAQIQAGGHLLAWLMGELPQLSLASVRGVSEFIPHGSPGEQWLAGRRWKDILLNAVADRLRDEAAPGPGGDVELQRQIRELQQQNETLLVQVGQVRRENGRLVREIEELRADPNRWKRVTPPLIHDISAQLPRHPSLRYERRRAETISHLAVHHTAMPLHIGPDRIAAIHVEADPERGKEAWPGIGYHFFVHGDGRIDQTQPLENLVYHVAGHNPQTVGVAFAGSFMNGSVPTPTQIRAGARLLAWLLQELKLPLQHVWGHKEFSGNRTTCPGSEWSDGRKWRDMLFEEIVRVQSGGGERPIHHYLLFWQQPHPGPLAATDLSHAQSYIERFRPTIGFDVETALQAKFVTIVGGAAGVSIQSEDRLRQAGAQVERIDGKDEAEIARMLKELVQKGRRFQHLVEDL